LDPPAAFAIDSIYDLLLPFWTTLVLSF
jgi:hypothetical protein